MTWAMAADFEFELPGPDWVEESIQSFSAEDASISQVVARTALPEEGVGPVLEFWKNKVIEAGEDHDVLGEDDIAVGEALGREVKLVVRTQGNAQYCRLIVVEYYELAVIFSLFGPARSLAEIDERADALIAKTEFRRQ
ncbi:MAG: hypothetical protein HOW73_39815 [Polyangiaceae bacterium]|nr:hypothetical protein [Polyangiaceae bacterium]